MFDTVLIANRGEIALRVMRACKELGLRTVAVYSEADRDALHVRYADDAYLIGPPPAVQSYLQIETIIDVARRAGAGAIHPGYGFLAENAGFAAACAEAGIVFIGPPVGAMERMGGKIPARQVATAAHVPLVPGTTEAVETAAEARRLGAQYGYPIAIKASAGGGGRGLKVAYADDEVEAAFDSARREAEAAFKSGELFVEKYVLDPRHIEIQVLADQQGNVVYLGERDCSVQRRHQKLIEETPSPAITPATRAEMGAAAVRLCQAVGYVGAGTLEFLLTPEGQFYFLEMNTRIQVEHTVTEMVTGIDLVAGQIRVARGEPLPWTQEQITLRGHAIECRINAEDAGAGFRPALGTVSAYREPAGYGVRVDSGVEAGSTISPYYDSMLAKLITWGETRAEALARMRRALDDYQVEGLVTTIPFHKLALAEPAFERGEATVSFIPRFLEDKLKQLPGAAPADTAEEPAASRTFEIEVNGRRFSVRVAGDGLQPAAPAATAAPGRQQGGGRRAKAKAKHHADPNAVVCPIQGTVVAIKTAPGAQVEAGQVLFVVEAMKMENEITAPRAGTVKELGAAIGVSVEAGTTLATLE
ncbi:MAG TPA: acetyl-CoA carboxylase biotin carboxylase subunit [Herpetosiphonaceae bacterium]